MIQVLAPLDGKLFVARADSPSFTTPLATDFFAFPSGTCSHIVGLSLPRLSLSGPAPLFPASSPLGNQHASYQSRARDRPLLAMFAEAINLLATTTAPQVHRYGFGWNLTATRSYLLQGLQSLQTTPVEGIASPTVALDDNLDLIISSFGYVVRNRTLVPVTGLADEDGRALRNAIDFAGFSCQAPPSPFVERDPTPAPATRAQQDTSLVIGLVATLLVCLLIVAAVSFRLHQQRGQPFDFTEMVQQLIVSMPRPAIAPPPELSSGSVKAGAVIGAGLFGSVLAGTLASGKGLRKNQSAVALKTCKAADPVSQRTFLFEACLLAQFSDEPHVVRLLGVVTTRQPLYLVMERCEDNLQHYLSEKFNSGKELKVDVKLRFAKEVALGMECLVKAGCVHRDLSCRNVL